MRTLAALILGVGFCQRVTNLIADEPKAGEPSSAQSSPLVRGAEEFKILTGDMGMRPGAPPSVHPSHKLKLLWHGRVYEFFRNDALDAIPHQVKQNGQTKSPLRRNQFGFSVAGPVLIPHVIRNPHSTFFMLSYEGVREEAFQASLHTIPTAPERLGDFSQTVDPAGHPLPIYDPTTTVPNPDYNPNVPVSTSNLQYLRSTFPGNIIPANRLDSSAEQALSFYPEPNAHVGPFFQNNYFVNSGQLDDADGFITRLDHTFNPRNELTGHANVSNGLLAPAPYFPNAASPTPPPQHFSNWLSGLDYTFTPDPSTVNTIGLTVASNVVRASFGSSSPFPNYDMQGEYLSMGVAYPTSRNARNTIELSEGLSIHKGKHSFDLSLHENQYQVNTFDPVYPSGYFQFSPGLTSLPGIIDTGDPFASMVLGLPQYAQKSITTSPSYFRDSYQSVAISDQYQLSKNLMLNFGLDLSRRSPRVEKYNRLSTVDPLIYDPLANHMGGLAFAGRNGIPRGLRPANTDLDPSVGLAWNPLGHSNTVVRASFSRYHSMIPIYDGQWGTQGFNAQQTFFSANTQLSPALNLATGLPPYTVPLPDFSPSAAENTTADFVDLSGKEPVFRSVLFTVQRDFPFSLVITGGAEYRDGHDILVGDGAANPNAINPIYLSYGDALYNQAFRETLQPYPQYLGFSLYGLYAAGAYQRTEEYIQVQKQESHGLLLTATYEHSRQLDDYSNPYGNQYLLNLRQNWSLSSYNPPQFIQLSYTYNLPFGPNQPLLHFSGVGGSLASGWSLYGTAYWNGGTPLSMHPEFNNTGEVIPSLYVNVVPDVNPRVPHRGPSLWFNPAAFIQPPNFTLGDGTATQSNLLGPGYNTLALSVSKRLPIGGSRVLEFSATAFNLINHGNWNTPDTGIGSAAAPNVNAGHIIGSYGGRVVQLELDIDF